MRNLLKHIAENDIELQPLKKNAKVMKHFGEMSQRSLTNGFFPNPLKHLTHLQNVGNI